MEFDVDAGKLTIDGDGVTTSFSVNLTDAPQQIPKNATFIASANGFNIESSWNGKIVTFVFDKAPPAGQPTIVAVQFTYQGI